MPANSSIVSFRVEPHPEPHLVERDIGEPAIAAASIFDRRLVPLRSGEAKPSATPAFTPDGFRRESDREFADRLLRRAMELVDG